MIRGWEVINEYGSSVIALSKQISDDEDVFVSFKADMQSDITIPEDVFFIQCFRTLIMQKESADAELQFKVFQNVGTHTNEPSDQNANADSYGIDLQMIFVVCDYSIIIIL